MKVKWNRWKLYAYHGLSSWGERGWQFALSLALFKLGGNLRLPAVANFAMSAAVILAGDPMGRLIDRLPRLTAARVTLAANDLLDALSAVAVCALLASEGSVGPVLYWALVGTAILLCALGEVGGSGERIVATKDWVVVMAAGDAEALAQLNAAMVRIDQIASILSPIVAATALEAWGYVWGCAFIGAWSALSFPIGLLLLQNLHDSVPALQRPKLEPTETKEELLHGGNEPLAEPVSSGPLRGVRAYFGQREVWGAGLPLALLYITVLGLDGITSSYIVSQGVTATELSLARAGGAVAGLAGSVVFPPLRRAVGLHRATITGLGLETLCLGLTLSSVFVATPERWMEASIASNSSETILMPTNLTGPASPTLANHTLNQAMAPSNSSSPLAIWLFVAGIVASRLGLWMSDLGLTQAQQQASKETERGVVFGVQTALNMGASLTKDVAVMALPEPGTFGALVVASVGAVTGAFLLYIGLVMCSPKSRGEDKMAETDADDVFTEV